MGEEKKKEEEPERELDNIRPTKVSLVDLGANGQYFFVAKSVDVKREKELPEGVRHIIDFLYGVSKQISDTTEWLKSAELDDEAGMPVMVSQSFVRARDSISDLLKYLDDPTQMETAKVSGKERDKTVAILDALSDTLNGAIEKAEGYEDGLTEEFVEDVKQVLAGLDTLACQKSEDEEAEDAVWTTAYINDLPDSAFLYIIPGGEKDEEGKTVPRTNRKFPYKNDEGKLDLPHLRNAIARIPQSNLSQDLKDQLQARARRILEEATKQADGESGQEETMGSKFVELVKSFKKEEVELDLVEVKKQAFTAQEKLNEILAFFDLEPEVEKDSWTVSWKIAEAIELLANAAKLDHLLSAKLEEEEEPASEEEMEEKQGEEEEEPPAGEEDEEEEMSAETKKSAEQPQVDIGEIVTKAIGEAIKPLSEKVEKIADDLKSTDEKVEKMDRTRAVAKGASSDDTQTQKSADEDEGSLFTDIMPTQLRGVATRE